MFWRFILIEKYFCRGKKKMEALVVLPRSSICLNTSCPVRLMGVNTLLSAGHESSDFTWGLIISLFLGRFLMLCLCKPYDLCTGHSTTMMSAFLTSHHICINNSNSDLANSYFAVILLAD